MMRLFPLLLAALLWGFSAGAVLADDTEGATDGAAATDGHDHETPDGHAEEDHPEEGGVNPIEIDADLAWFTLVVFVVLAALLRAVAWDPIMKALEKRESNIHGEIAAAAMKHEEAKALLAEHQAKIAAATDDVKAMLDEARRDAEHTKAQIVEDARKAAADEKARAIREVEQARDAAIKTLAEQSANLAIDLASKVVKQEISPERQGEIISEAIGRLASAEPSSN